MGPVQSIKTCLRKSVSFSGRASRSEFWWFAGLAILVAGSILWWDSNFPRIEQGFIHDRGLWLVIPLTALSLAAAGCRRAHDTGKRGIIFLVPFSFSILLYIGLMRGLISFNWGGTTGGSHAIFSMSGIQSTFVLMTSLVAFPTIWFVLSVFLLFPSQPHSNKFGPNPHEVSP